MPELPEVETVIRGLKEKITGKIIREVTLRRADLRIPFPENLAGNLAGRKIISLARRAKYILMHLDDSNIIIAHLGMSGKIMMLEKGYKPQKHDHALISFNSGDIMVFNDPRRFGLLTLTRKKDLQTHKLFKSLGAEPLSPEFTGKTLHGILKNKNTNIKNALMDQNFVVGVGNIYAAESLYLAGISPLRSSKKINSAESARLAAAIKTVLNSAIKAGGSTISDYRTATGKNGQFQLKFQVYGRKGKKCLKCQDIIEAIRQNGRSSFYCPSCQS